jgi:uncharacterized protein YdhG (YjbR/CyaY superfamily)
MKKTKPATVDEYFAHAPERSRAMLSKMRTVIKSSVPRGVTETISYQIPAFAHDGVLVWYAAFANHCSLFPTGEVIEACKKDLEGFRTSKGTVQFPLDKPLPVTLIRKLVKSRVAMREGKGGTHARTRR